MSERNRLSENQQIVRADRFATLFKMSSKRTVSTIGKRIERQDFEDTKDCIELRRKPR